DRPGMAEWILNNAIARTPELVVEGHDDCGARLHRTLEDRIGIRNLKMNGHRRAAGKLRRFGAGHSIFGKIIDEHDHAAIDRERGMHEALAVLCGHFHGRGGAEGLFVEGDRSFAVIDVEMRNYAWTLHLDAPRLGVEVFIWNGYSGTRFGHALQIGQAR